MWPVGSASMPLFAAIVIPCCTLENMGMSFRVQSSMQSIVELSRSMAALDSAGLVLEWQDVCNTGWEEHAAAAAYVPVRASDRLWVVPKHSTVPSEWYAVHQGRGCHENRTDSQAAGPQHQPHACVQALKFWLNSHYCACPSNTRVWLWRSFDDKAVLAMACAG